MSTGLVLATQRWYSPELRRWMSRDPIGYDGGVNLYEYVGSNPVGFVDPEGTDALSTFLELSSDSLGGFGDRISFNLTRYIRERLDRDLNGGRPSVRYESEWYRGGEISADVFVCIGGVSIVRAIRRGKEFHILKARVAPFGNSRSVPLGKWPHYHRARINKKTGQPFNGQGAKRHRPFEKKSTDKSFWDRF